MSPPDIASQSTPAGLAFIDRSDRGRLDVLGPDRAKFLHNLTTNDVKRLAVGRGHEAFVTSLQGKTLGYVTLLATDDRIILRTDPGALPLLLPHLQKYGVFDEVSLAPSPTFEFHLIGPEADERLRSVGGEPPDEMDLAHRMTLVGNDAVRAVRESPTGRPGLTLIGDDGAAARVLGQLAERAPLREIDPDEFETMRIEAGTPVFGRDVTADNLPQEVGRDSRAISFVKGCYLGQETVARIDALGHVNKLLKGLVFPAGTIVPPPGTVLEADGKTVGTITSSAFASARLAPVALGFVRTAHAKAGTTLQARLAEGTIKATVHDLPMTAP
jgi:folate-binding protein YgfZ